MGIMACFCQKVKNRTELTLMTECVEKTPPGHLLRTVLNTSQPRSGAALNRHFLLIIVVFDVFATLATVKSQLVDQYLSNLN